MKKKLEEIGRGAQYKVFRLSKDRVYKELLSREETLEIVSRWYEVGEIPKDVMDKDYRKLAIKSNNQIDRMIALHPKTSRIFGNPEFNSDGSYTQDYAPQIQNYFHKSLRYQKRIIDKYIGLILELLEYGMTETTFCYNSNHGLIRKREAVLIDFGEISTNKIEVIKIYKNELWQESYFIKHELNSNLKDYLIKEFRDKLTEEVIEERWKRLV